MGEVLGAGTHRMDDHRVVGVDAEHADLRQITVAARTDAHREVIVEQPLGDGVANRVKHVFVSDVVLVSCMRDTHC